MANIIYREFQNISALNESVAALLKHHIEEEWPHPHAVMLAGGKTPMPAYQLLAKNQCCPSSSLHLLFSDERLVPISSSASNFGNLRFLADALHLEEQKLIRVNEALEPAEAAAQYERDIRTFFNKGGRIALGLLGLGPDGHTASLFSQEDMERGRGCYAVQAIAPDGMPRVSVTPGLLEKIRQIIFVVSGAGKKSIVETMMAHPSALVAGLAVAGIKSKELWFAC